MHSPADLRAIPDPARRLAATREAQAATDALQAELGTIVRESVQEMTQAASISAVAAELGVTRQRVQQLLRPTRGQEHAGG